MSSLSNSTGCSARTSPTSPTRADSHSITRLARRTASTLLRGELARHGRLPDRARKSGHRVSHVRPRAPIPIWQQHGDKGDHLIYAQVFVKLSKSFRLTMEAVRGIANVIIETKLAPTDRADRSGRLSRPRQTQRQQPQVHRRAAAAQVQQRHHRLQSDTSIDQQQQQHSQVQRSVDEEGRSRRRTRSTPAFVHSTGAHHLELLHTTLAPHAAFRRRASATHGPAGARVPLLCSGELWQLRCRRRGKQWT